MSEKDDRKEIVINTRRRRHIARLALLVALGTVILGGSTAVSYYVDALWFESLGLASVFWTQAQPSGRDLRSLCPRDLSGGLWRFPGAQAQLSWPAGRRHDALQPAAGRVAGRARPQAAGARAFDGHSGRHRRQHDGAVDDPGPLLGRAAQHRLARPHLWAIARFLSVHAAGLAARLRVAAHTVDHRLSDRCAVRRDHRRCASLDRMAIVRGAGETLARAVGEPRRVLTRCSPCARTWGASIIYSRMAPSSRESPTRTPTSP